MRQPDVMVVVEGGVAHIEVLHPEVLVEVRDYDTDGALEKELWENEDGDKCHRYFVEKENERRRRDRY